MAASSSSASSRMPPMAGWRACGFGSSYRTRASSPKLVGTQRVVGQSTDDVAVADGLAVAAGGDALQLGFQPPQLGDLFAHGDQLLLRDLVGVAAGLLRVPAQFY